VRSTAARWRGEGGGARLPVDFCDDGGRDGDDGPGRAVPAGAAAALRGLDGGEDVVGLEKLAGVGVGPLADADGVVADEDGAVVDLVVREGFWSRRLWWWW
jgi:hypothetical protein